MLRLIWITAVGGTLAYGRDFWNMLGAWIGSGYEAIAETRYYGTIRKSLKFAVAIPFVGGILGLLAAHFYGIRDGQKIIYGSFGISFVLLFLLLFLANAFAAIAVGGFPIKEERKAEYTALRRGFKKRVQRGMAWEIGLGVILICIGVYAKPWVFAMGVAGFGLYFMTAEAYNRPVTWGPNVLMAIGMILMLTTVVVSTPTPLGVMLGINFRSALQTGIDTPAFDAVEVQYYAILRQKCTDEVNAITAGIKKINIKDADALPTLKNKMGELEAKKKECLGGKTLAEKWKEWRTKK